MWKKTLSRVEYSCGGPSGARPRWPRERRWSRKPRSNRRRRQGGWNRAPSIEHSSPTSYRAIASTASCCRRTYDGDRDPAYPLLLLLHGGGGSRDFLDTWVAATKDLWRRLDPFVGVCPSAGRSFYMNYRDGSEAWETLLVTELLDAVRSEFRVAAERARVAVSGVSMGGMGCLRLAFKHPDLFGTVAALEPAIEASLSYDALQPADTFYRADQYPEKFGIDGVVDEGYWAENNSATIAANAPERLRDLAIMIEAGTEDGFELHRGAEFLHRVLWDRGLQHEYRTVLGADHIGRSLNERFRYACAFISRQWNPEPVDEDVVEFRKLIAPQRRQAGLD